MISDRAPSDYLAEIRKTPGFPFDAVLDLALPSGWRRLAVLER